MRLAGGNPLTRSLPIRCEETELAIRARRRRPGSVVLHVPQARVEHNVTAERATWRYLFWRCWAEGRSKAVVGSIVGTEAALASERPYVSRTLPSAFARGLLDGVRGDPSGVLRAAAIVTALATTLAGYLVGRLAMVRWGSRPPTGASA